MANLIIKPNSATGDKLIIQDRDGGAVLTTADSGATIANATLNSPTMITPALGTPASGVVTNLSGVLPVGVTGGSGLEAVPGRYFYAYTSDAANQSISYNTHTKVTLPNATQSHTAFNTSTYVWTATASDAGVWYFRGQVSLFSEGNNADNPITQIWKNGSHVAGGYSYVGNTNDDIRHFSVHTQHATTIASGNTIELRGYMGSGGSNLYFFGGDAQGYKQCSLFGCKL